MSVCQRQDLTCRWSNIYLNSPCQPFTYGPWQTGTRSAVGQCWGHLWASVAPGFCSESTLISSRAWWGDTSLWLAVLLPFSVFFPSFFFLLPPSPHRCPLHPWIKQVLDQSRVVLCPCLSDEYRLLPPGGMESYFLSHRCIMYELSAVVSVVCSGPVFWHLSMLVLIFS